MCMQKHYEEMYTYMNVRSGCELVYMASGLRVCGRIRSVMR
jgi:hypothetical protein